MKKEIQLASRMSQIAGGTKRTSKLAISEREKEKKNKGKGNQRQEPKSAHLEPKNFLKKGATPVGFDPLTF